MIQNDGILVLYTALGQAEDLIKTSPNNDLQTPSPNTRTTQKKDRHHTIYCEFDTMQTAQNDTILALCMLLSVSEYLKKKHLNFDLFSAGPS